jgi:HSP20 family protein
MRDTWLPALWGERKGEIDPFRALRSQMDELFSDFAGGFPRLTGGGDGLLALRVDVSETPAELTVKADLPGVQEKNIDITVSGDQLTIKAEKKSEADEKKDEKGRIYHRTERSYGFFQRTMTLPFDIDPQKVGATFKDGVLTVSLPKPAEVQKQTKKIEVKKAS